MASLVQVPGPHWLPDEGVQESAWGSAGPDGSWQVFMVPTDCQRLATLESHGSVNKGLAVRGLTGAGPAPHLVTAPFMGTKLPLKKQSPAALGGLVTHHLSFTLGL